MNTVFSEVLDLVGMTPVVNTSSAVAGEVGYFRYADNIMEHQ